MLPELNSNKKHCPQQLQLRVFDYFGYILQRKLMFLRYLIQFQNFTISPTLHILTRALFHMLEINAKIKNLQIPDSF